MNSIVITPKSKESFELLISLAKLLGEKMNVVSDKVLSESLFVAEIEHGIEDGILTDVEKKSFMDEIKQASLKK